MKTPLLTAFTACAFALPAQAQTCQFQIECYEDEACQDTQFSLTAVLDEEKLSTDFGDITVVGVKREGRLTAVFATGQASEYLLSRVDEQARFTAHSNQGPAAITYIGTCEGEF